MEAGQLQQLRQVCKKRVDKKPTQYKTSNEQYIVNMRVHQQQKNSNNAEQRH